MRLTMHIDNADYAIDLAEPMDISIPIRFEGERLAVFGDVMASREAYKSGGFIGDVARGGSCNCEIYTLAPHLHGTHTECVGHIANSTVNVIDILQDRLIPALVITVDPIAGTGDSYIPRARSKDLMITKDALVCALEGKNPAFGEALVVRTTPNDHRKVIRDYNQNSPPFFSVEAMNYIVSLGVEHLLVDFPSIDRADDDGKLTNHHIFWGIPQGSHRVKDISPKTVTELVFAPDEVKDGHYLLNLQLAAMEGDAVPSCPVLYKAAKK